MAPTIAILSAGPPHFRKTAVEAKKALDALSYNTVEIDVDNDVTEQLKRSKPDLAFLALHSPHHTDGDLQGLLKILGIKHTHSGTLPSAIAANKVMSKYLFQSIGIETPRGHTLSRADILNGDIKMAYPYVLKPTNEGSSLGVHVIFSPNDFLKLIKAPAAIREEMMVEEFVPGADLSTAVLFDEAVGTIEVRTQTGFYSNEAKVTQERVEKVFPAEVPEDVYKKTLEYALQAHRFLGCGSISRSDFRYNPQDNTLKMLEINTFPHLKETSQFARIVKLARGIDFNDLFRIIVEEKLQFANG